ncbi:Arsenite methyltransferase [subsurface metagenome]|jgi:ubiquinone/menaquinone biosynthesis C-methylase UbiE
MNTKEKKIDAKKIREEVKKTYAEAISRKNLSCCGNSEETCCSTKAKDIGYREDELNNLLTDSNITTFGCGNPLAFSEVREGDIVLDLGPGAGLDLLIAARKVGPSGQVIGVDMTEEMISKAEENIKAAGVKNVEVRKGLIEDLPVKSSSVDWVISNCVINLSPEKEKVFSEISRVLKPGGRMVVSDMVGENIPEWLRENKNLYSACISGVISEKEYLSGLRKAGLEKVKVSERIIYQSDELESFVKSEPEISKVIKRIIREPDIKVASVKISAYKPAL